MTCGCPHQRTARARFGLPRLFGFQSAIGFRTKEKGPGALPGPWWFALSALRRKPQSTRPLGLALRPREGVVGLPWAHFALGANDDRRQCGAFSVVGGEHRLLHDEGG